MDYTVVEFSRFKKLYKKARKNYNRNFDDDFDTVMQVIEGRMSESLYGQDPEKVPNTNIISRLGDGVEHDICKTRMYIEDAQSKIGRLVWLHDDEYERIYLIEIYHKNQRDNHSRERIRMAYREYQEEYLGL